MKILRNWLIFLIVNSVIMLAVAGYFPSFHLEGIGAALLASFILSIMNVIVRPILVVFTLPVTILTFGLFLIIINAVTLMLTSAVMGDLFKIDTFGAAIVAAIVISLLNMAVQKVIIDPLQKRK